MNETPQVVTIAGHDSDGSAGMPADLHSFYARKVYGMGIMTAAVAGNSYGIDAAQVMPPDFIAQQFDTLHQDFVIKACKTGMLADSATIEVVAAKLSTYDFGPLVLDPVITTKHGAMLLAEEAYASLKKKLFPLATVLTPNYFETQKLTGLALANEHEIEAAARCLQDLGAQNIVLKGAHHFDHQTEVHDYVLLADGSSHWLSHPFVNTQRINGTGDSFSAVITAELAKGTPLLTAIQIAVTFVHRAISQPLAVGHRFGPINHWSAKD